MMLISAIRDTLSHLRAGLAYKLIGWALQIHADAVCEIIGLVERRDRR